MPKIFKMFFPKKSFGPILNLDANVTSCKICFIHSFSNTWKIPYFGHILGPFWPKNFIIKLSPKKSLHSFLNICATVTSCKKIGKFPYIDFWYLQYSILGPIWAIFGTETLKQNANPWCLPNYVWPLFAQKPQNKTFHKKSVSLCCCNFMQKTRKFHMLI